MHNPVQKFGNFSFGGNINAEKNLADFEAHDWCVYL